MKDKATIEQFIRERFQYTAPPRLTDEECDHFNHFIFRMYDADAKEILPELMIRELHREKSIFGDCLMRYLNQFGQATDEFGKEPKVFSCYSSAEAEAILMWLMDFAVDLWGSEGYAHPKVDRDLLSAIAFWKLKMDPKADFSRYSDNLELWYKEIL